MSETDLDQRKAQCSRSRACHGTTGQLNALECAWAACDLNRPIDRLVEEAGSQMPHLENFLARGLRATSYMY